MIDVHCSQEMGLNSKGSWSLCTDVVLQSYIIDCVYQRFIDGFLIMEEFRQPDDRLADECMNKWIPINQKLAQNQLNNSSPVQPLVKSWAIFGWTSSSSDKLVFYVTVNNCCQVLQWNYSMTWLERCCAFSYKNLVFPTMIWNGWEMGMGSSEKKLISE